ncbi:hypothetical protein F8388_015845 [Cannabis sativa]|uniref:CRAL/TRIO N-terminal domain-containing protein n=1 Tax=Cannabis sativa TaxID=3483 RepID=A0A7J6DYG5_CANSA|nr:hypothetical protein F8388_015845 [Cannabis sativa]
MWGVPLLADDRSDVILLKFLRARDYKVKEAFTMLKNTVMWRREIYVHNSVQWRSRHVEKKTHVLP